MELRIAMVISLLLVSLASAEARPKGSHEYCSKKYPDHAWRMVKERPGAGTQGFWWACAAPPNQQKFGQEMFKAWQCYCNNDRS